MVRLQLFRCLKRSSNRCVVWFVLLGSSCLAGCSGDTDWQAKTVKVIGEVTVNGEVPEGAIVKLHSAGADIDSRASRPSGLVQADGSYELTTYDYGDGAPPGDYIFTLYWPQDPRVGGMSPDRLGNAYATPLKSTIKLTITEETDELEPVAITGATITMPAAGTPPTHPGPPGLPTPTGAKGS